MKKALIFILFIWAGFLFAQLEDSEITVSDHNIEVGDSFEVIISTTELLSSWNVTAYQFDLGFDDEIVDYVGYDIFGTISDGGMVLVNDEDNSISVGYMNTTALVGAGDLIKLEFIALSDGFSVLDISSFLYNATSITELTDGSVTIIEVLYPPTNLTYTLENENDVVLEWIAPTNGARLRSLEGYKIYRDDEEIAEVSDLTYTDENISNGEYEYYVTAIYTSGESDPSNIIEVEIEVLYPPQAPQNVSITTSELDVILSWETVTHDTAGNTIPSCNYKIYNSSSPDFQIGSGHPLVTTNDTTYIHTNALQTGKMFYKVTATSGFVVRDSSFPADEVNYDVHKQ